VPKSIEPHVKNPIVKVPRNAEQTRKALLAAAQQVFATSGFAGARVDVIAQVSGFNKSLIFQYFGDKDGIYRAVVAQLRTESDSSYLEAINPLQYLEPELTRAGLREFLERSLHWIFLDWLSQPNRMGILSWRMAEGSQLFDTENLSKMPGMVASLTVFQHAQRMGFIQASLEPKLITMTVMSLPLMYMRLLPLEARDDPKRLAAVCEQVLIFLLEGVLVQK
jgi:TetR/AcrR family transcriptional regulator